MTAREPPAWRFERQAAPFRVECPVCDAVTYDYCEYEEFHGNVDVLVLLAELLEGDDDD